MRCAESLRLLDGYVDDQLEAGGVLALQEHLRGCGRCRARELGLRELRGAVRRSTRYRLAPARLHVDMARDFGSPPARADRGRRWGIAAAFATLLAAAGIGAWAPAHLPSGPQTKVVYHISSSAHVGAALRTLNNHLEASPRTKVVVVAHNEGVNFLLRGARDENGTLVEPVVHAFHERGVEFRVCTNTLVRRKMDAGLVLPDATLVPSGIAEISRLQEKEGYAYMRL